MGRPFQGERRVGYTVVEMLIVILLIGLLVAVAVPAYSQMLASAKRAQCKTNLRQIGVALQTYATANGNLLPTNEPGGEAVYPWPPGRETTGPLREDVSTNIIGMRNNPWGLGKLHEQLGGDLRVLFCPTDPRRDAAAYSHAFITNRLLDNGDSPNCSYLFRGRDAPDKVDTAAIRIFHNEHDSVRALVMDYYHTGMGRRNHDQRICVLFEDGRALDARVSTGSAPDRFVLPQPVSEEALNQVWRLADGVYEGGD